VVLVPTLAPGVNVDNIGEIVDYALQRSPTVRGIHFQPISYFGRYPEAPDDASRITIPEVIRAIEEQTGGKIRNEHFEPPGAENAMCSFHANFVLMPDGKLVAWTRRKTQCCCEPTSAADGVLKSQEFVARNWIAPDEVITLQTGPSLGEWDTLLERARTYAFGISGMAFQDAWDLDLERLKDCCIHTVSPDGRIIPFCAYNLTDRSGRAIYRGQKSAARAHA
jgi:7,8-dihydro-6-hydroxymethylpterin dimethyltransferase